MYDQSFCKKTIGRVLQKRDFRGVPAASQSDYREELIDKALAAAFVPSPIPLVAFPLGGKVVYRIGDLNYELVLRKLCQNIKRSGGWASQSRSQIVSNLKLLLAEGVPYRIYRLDVSSYYESFDKQDVQRELHNLSDLAPQSKSLTEALLGVHATMGGTGVPRGLSISAILSDYLMRRFDDQIKSNHDTFYYSRYVDDIVIVTSARESSDRYIRWIAKILPKGLKLNPNKKDICEAPKSVKPIKNGLPENLISFDYLGYKFSVKEPVFLNNKRPGDHNRLVEVDIARRKVKKIKTRIVRSILDFGKNHDWALLRDRIAYLTQNFSVYNPKAGGKKLAGIYHSYPLLTEGAAALSEMDRFLRNAVLAKAGRVFSKKSLSASQRHRLLAYSFVTGHKKRGFVHFSGQRISQIQACWMH